MAAPISISDAELKAAIYKIRALGDFVTKKERKKMLRKGATILRDAARSNVPVSSEPHKSRSGKIYYPGNLRDAIQVKNFRKSGDLFVGAVTNSAATASVFGSEVAGQKSKVDGYYAHWVEFGAQQYKQKPNGYAYMRRALAATKETVIAQIISDATKLFNQKIKELQRI